METAQGEEVEEASDKGSETILREEIGTTVMGSPPRLSAMPEGWLPELGSIPSDPITEVHSLGDLHGWAPGLITYLIEHQLATVEVNGLSLYTKIKGGTYELDEENINTVFPDPYSEYKESKQFPPAGLEGQLLADGKTARRRGHHSVKAEWVCEEPGVAFVQIGDVFDRSDHSELASEILRQLIIQAPLRVFVLVGNHEQFFLEGDHGTWIHNEQRWTFDKSKHSSEVGFQSRTLSENDDDLFHLYSCSASLLYLTQGAVLDYAIKGTAVRDWILRGDFEAAQQAYQEMSRVEKGDIDGAVVTLLIGHTMFAHAEPSAFVNESASYTVLSRLKDNVQSVSETEIAFDYYEKAGSIQDSLHRELLWSRGADIGIGDSPPAPSMAIESMRRAISIFPGLRHYVHGHSPVVLSNLQDVRSSNPVSYLARRGEGANPEVGSVRIHMIDSGICPVYHVGEGDIFDPTRIPIGLGLTEELVPYQDPYDERSESWESDSGLWLVNHTDEISVKCFTLPPRLTALEPTRIGSLSEGGVRLSDSGEPWGEGGVRFRLHNGTLLIPSVKGMGAEDVFEFVIWGGQSNSAKRLLSTEGEMIEMDRVVLHPEPMDESWIRNDDSLDKRLDVDDPDQWFELIPILRVRLHFHRNAVLVDARSSMEAPLHLHLAALKSRGVKETIEIPSRAHIRERIKSKGRSPGWFVSLGNHRSESFEILANGWVGDFIDALAGLKQVLNSDVGDIFRVVLKPNGSAGNAPRNWDESRVRIESAADKTVLAERETEEASPSSEAHSDSPYIPSRVVEPDPTPNPTKSGIQFKKRENDQSSDSSSSLPIKESLPIKKSPLRMTGHASHGSTFTTPRGKKSKTEKKQRKTHLPKAAGSDSKPPDSPIAATSSDRVSEWTEINPKSEEITSSHGITVRMSIGKGEPIDLLPEPKLLEQLSMRIPDYTTIKRLPKWAKTLVLRRDYEFINKPLESRPESGCALRLPFNPHECVSHVQIDRVTLTHQQTSDKLIFEIKYYEVTKTERKR